MQAEEQRSPARNGRTKQKSVLIEQPPAAPPPQTSRQSDLQAKNRMNEAEAKAQRAQQKAAALQAQAEKLQQQLKQRGATPTGKGRKEGQHPSISKSKTPTKSNAQRRQHQVAPQFGCL